jgi:hypothetical protein
LKGTDPEDPPLDLAEAKPNDAGLLLEVIGDNAA